MTVLKINNKGCIVLVKKQKCFTVSCYPINGKSDRDTEVSKMRVGPDKLLLYIRHKINIITLNILTIEHLVCARCCHKQFACLISLVFTTI